MAGHFTKVIPEQCEHYARFIHRISRRQADVIFWGNFCMTIILLIIASQMYTKASLNPSHRRIRLNCLLISLFCFSLALPCVALSALAGLQIEFCDGEDLMHFYWSFWTLIQVGSLIAILGVSVNQCYGIGGKRGPPWNVALGTPVLVIAALGHAGETGGKAIWKRISKRTLRDTEDGRASSDGGEVDLEAQVPDGKKMVQGESAEHREERMDKNVGPQSSRASTIINSAESRQSASMARHVGYTLDNEPLYALSLAETEGITRSPSTVSIKSVVVGDRLPPREIRFADELEVEDESRRSSSSDGSMTQ